MSEVERKENLAKEAVQELYVRYGSDKYLLSLIISELEKKTWEK